MSEIHTILSKHLAGEASPQEESLAQQFKLENPKEYNIYKSFWSEENIDLKKFDTAEGWNSVAQKATKANPTKSGSILKWLSAIAIGILLSFASYLYFSQSTSPEQNIYRAIAQNEKVLLEDGSIVYLNKNATLTYIETFQDNKREVNLQGEAFFEIAKDADRPFIVHTEHSDVEVLGTSFNINTNTANTTVSVATGKVKVEGHKTKKTSLLTPNQAVIVSHKNQTETEVAHNYLSWKTGVFNFKKTPISEAINELNQYYDNTITLVNQSSDCLFSSTLTQLDITELLEIIELSCGLTSTKINDIHELR